MRQRVLFVSHSLGFGGVESHLNSIADRINDNYGEAIFCALTSGGIVSESLSKRGHKVVLLDSRARVPDLLALFRLSRLIRELSPDVVHCFGVEANFHGIVAARIFGVSRVFAEEIGTPSHSRKARWILNLIYRFANGVIVPTKRVKERLVSLNEAPAHKISILPNPVETSAPVPIPKETSPFRLVFVGRLEPEKNALALVKAMTLLTKGGENVSLDIYGHGSQYEAIVGEIEARELTRRISLHGQVNAPFGACAAAHLFVQPSLTEGFGIALIEAMSAGIPVLTTQVGIAQEIIEDGSNGWFLPDSSETTIAATITKIIKTGTNMLQKVGQRGKDQVGNLFAPEEYLRKLRELHTKNRSENFSNKILPARKDEVNMAVGHYKILHALGWVTQGGVERLRASTAEHLSDQRFQHHLICQIAEDPLLGVLTSYGWKVYEIGTAHHILDLPWYLRAWKVSRSIRPHLVHGAVFEGCALATFLGIVHPRAKVILEEQSDGRHRSWRGTVLLRIFSFLADKHIGVAPQIVQYLRDDVRVQAKKLVLLDNAVPDHPRPSAKKTEELRKRLGLTPNDFVLGSVGRLNDDHKRFSDLIRAIGGLNRSFNDIKLLIVGGGEDEEILRDLANELGVDERVIFTGFRPDVRELVHIMDAFALVSSGEALPLALIEAMHSGVAAIATDVGGNRYVLDQGRAGILIPPSNPLELRISIERLFRDPELRDRLGTNGRRRAMMKFSLNHYLVELAGLWSELLKIPRKPKVCPTFEAPN